MEALGVEEFELEPWGMNISNWAPGYSVYLFCVFET